MVADLRHPLQLQILSVIKWKRKVSVPGVLLEALISNLQLFLGENGGSWSRYVLHKTNPADKYMFNVNKKALI